MKTRAGRRKEKIKHKKKKKNRRRMKEGRSKKERDNKCHDETIVTRDFLRESFDRLETNLTPIACFARIMKIKERVVAIAERNYFCIHDLR